MFGLSVRHRHATAGDQVSSRSHSGAHHRLLYGKEVQRDLVWEANQGKYLPCTHCGAGIGAPCRTPKGATCPPHKARWQLDPEVLR